MTGEIKWQKVSLTLFENVDAKPILEYIYENFITEFLAYDEKYFYNEKPLNGPVRLISFCTTVTDSENILKLMVKKFPSMVAIGSSMPYTWAKEPTKAKTSAVISSLRNDILIRYHIKAMDVSK